MNDKYFVIKIEECPDCKGAGSIVKDGLLGGRFDSRCSRCNGFKTVEVRENLEEAINDLINTSESFSQIMVKIIQKLNRLITPPEAGNND